MKHNVLILSMMALAGMTSCTGMRVVTPEGGEVSLVGVGAQQDVGAMKNGSFEMAGYRTDSEKGLKNLVWGSVTAYGLGQIASVAKASFANDTTQFGAEQATKQAQIAAETEQLGITTDAQLGLAEIEAFAP